MSVVSEFCLSSFYGARLKPTPTYVDAWKIYLKYCIIHDYFNLIFETVFWAGRQVMPQKLTAFVFDSS